MTNQNRRRVAATALAGALALIAAGSIVACAATKKSDAADAAQAAEAAQAPRTADQVVLTPVAAGAAGAPRAARPRAPAGGEFAAFYHPQAERHLDAMEASLKPLEAITAQGD